jgi:hypothetical protein
MQDTRERKTNIHISMQRLVTISTQSSLASGLDVRELASSDTCSF